MSTSVASVTSHFPSAQNGFATTLASTISSGAATVPLNSVAGYNNGEIVVLVVDPTTSAKQTFTGVVDTAGVQITNVVWTAGTDVAHSGGATVVDYETATHWSMVAKGILRDHNQSGYHKTLNDNNGNEWIKQTSTASAVNEVTVANAATGNAPSMAATGGDTNIDLELGAKGTGSPRWIGAYDGWVKCNETLTYNTSSSFTCSAALAAVLKVGDRIKLTQTTVKYFYVVSVSGTTVTITGGTDYTLANAAITLPFFSHEASPTNFPHWFNFTTTFTNLTVGNGTVVSKFSLTGKTLTGRMSIVFGTTTSVSADILASAPMTAAAYAGTGNITGIGSGNAFDTSATKIYPMNVNMSSTTAISIRPAASDLTYHYTAIASSTIPFTWATGDEIGVSYVYEVA